MYMYVYVRIYCIKVQQADIVYLNEVRATQEQSPCDFSNYHLIWNECTEKKGYSGCCLLTKLRPLNVVKGIGCEDAQGRAITAEFEKFYLVGTYVPNSGEKLKFAARRAAWDQQMFKFLDQLQKTNKPVIWTGDLNVAIGDCDVYDGDTNPLRPTCAGFTPQERSNFAFLLDRQKRHTSDHFISFAYAFTQQLNMKDSYRQLHPNTRREAYTFVSAKQKNILLRFF
ncbi:exodeoxyribonuclease III [Reticulomyxa filosa]|uniref:Exodeoxyribonuclease III n=1 Tax=Reticulomyxa filosa TaxID=46433 RepID=X6NAT8_RETFI|nr:exodeoxyribonuclease III [Reticulomyxa filosa]|eukprot:ETO23385.1 exodeoxyribonuclease III [Reticulomyxa filosa]